MSLSSVEIKNLPLTDEIADSDLIIVEKQNYTAAAQGVIIKDYFINEITQVITANTYTADEVTLTLSANEFKVKDGGIGINQLDTGVLSFIGAAAATLSGNLITYSDPITAGGQFVEISVNIGGSSKNYALRLYELP